MPKLSRSRIINLNYNDGKRTIYNEIFDYGEGRDTLFSMENGIGKTVLIQFFLQPFIRNKRELAGRKFEDYFTGSAPTYIMHELLIDSGEKLLAGMVIKKDNTDDEKNKLRILTFLHKYSKPNDFDIVNAPFIDGRRILNFSEAEDKIKKYKSGKLNFNYYNFNDSSKKNQYFEDLKAFKVNYKEWEDIIRSINNDESGLSNLYDKHKTDEALIRNVIIPLIESKINGEKNAIEAIRNNLSKYIESYKQSKESFYEVDLLKSFKDEMTPVTEMLREGVLKEEARDALYKKLSAIAALCEEEFNNKFSEKLQCEEFVNELKNELTKVYYEEHSLNYYNIKDKEDKAEEKLGEFDELLKSKQDKLDGLVREKYIQESAEIYEELLIKESELAEVKERIANYEKEDSEIARNIRNYKFTLKNIYASELKDLKEKAEEHTNNERTIKENLSQNEKEQKSAVLELRENIRAEAEINNKIKNFEKAEQGFRKKHRDFTIRRNPLFNEYDAKELENYKITIDKSISASLTLQEKLNSETASLVSEREKLKNKLENANEELKVKREALSEKKNALNNFNKETYKLLELLRIKELPLNAALQKENLKVKIESDTAKLKDSLSKEQSKLREAEETVNRYETGLIQLPKEVVESFEDKGITFEYALSFLQKYKGSKEEKENLIKRNPFFPYGILLSTKDINLLKNESLDVFTSVPIPIINMSGLDKSLSIDKNNDIITIENAEFLLSFNHLLIDEEERTEILRTLRQNINSLSVEMEILNKAIDRNKEYALILTNYQYNGNENEELESEIKDLQASIKELEVLTAKCSEEGLNNEKRREAIIRELHEVEKKLLALEEKKLEFGEFAAMHDDFKKCSNEISTLRKLMEAINKREAKLREESSELQVMLKKAAVDLYEINNNIKDTSSRLSQYNDIVEGTFLEEAKNIIEAKLSSCEKKLGEDMRRDKTEEDRLAKDLERAQIRLNRTVKDGRLSQEYKNVKFSEQRLEELKREISSFEEQIKNINSEINTLDKELSKLIERKQHEVRDIEKLGFDVPIAKELIKGLNFKERENRIKEDMRQNEEIIKEYNDEIDRLKLLKQKLEFYKSYSPDINALDFDFKNLTAAVKIIDEYISTYEKVRKEILQIEDEISRKIGSIHEKYRDKNRFIKERLFDYLYKDRKISSHSDIESLLEVVDRRVSTLELELSSIKSEEEVVINEVLRYTNHVLEELRTIDKKSSIKHLGKTQKLLELSIPEEKEEESLREYIKGRVAYYGSFEGEYSNLLESDIQSAELLSKLIGNINRIRVDIKKIEKSGLIRKSWKDALSQNSGGEKFVSMFILLSSLMSYMRKRETDIDNREEKKILIMDNPFAKTNAEHLLEPMFQIAEKYNIQLICFSGIGGSAVYNRFDKIYVAKVVEDKFRNKENVSFKAGSEETLELSDFTITKEQISLF